MKLLTNESPVIKFESFHVFKCFGTGNLIFTVDIKRQLTNLFSGKKLLTRYLDPQIFSTSFDKISTTDVLLAK